MARNILFLYFPEQIYGYCLAAYLAQYIKAKVLIITIKAINNCKINNKSFILQVWYFFKKVIRNMDISQIN